MSLTRRQFLKLAAGAGVSVIGGCEVRDRTDDGIAASPRGSARVIVVGGGFGGSTAAKYLKMWAPDIDVVLVTREAEFVSCPLSNLALVGNASLQEITTGYGGLRTRGVRVVHDSAVAVDADKRQVRLARGAVLGYDRLVLSPSVDYVYDEIPGLRGAEAQARIPHAWVAGEQTVTLRKQLEAMPDGGVFVIQIPVAPFRCPPGPYERVCQVAEYFKRAKPRSKIILLDANPDLVSKRDLFLTAWDTLYKGMIDYRPNSELADIDIRTMTVKLVFEDVKGDVINIIPPQRAAAIARTTGLITANQRWCGVDWLTTESLAVTGIHVLGDATLAASAMPKSATMANQHAKICAAAIIALTRGEPVNADPVIMNTCYSFVNRDVAMHVTSVHRYDPKEKTMLQVKGAGGLSDQPSTQEGAYAWAWARNIWADSLG